MRLAFERGGEGVGFVGDARVEEAELLDLGLECGAVVAFGFVDGVDAGAKIGELLAQRMEEAFDLGFVMIGKLGRFFFEELGGDGLEFDLESGFEFFGVGEIAGREGFALGEALFGGGELRGGCGAGSGEVGLELGVEC